MSQRLLIVNCMTITYILLKLLKGDFQSFKLKSIDWHNDVSNSFLVVQWVENEQVDCRISTKTSKKCHRSLVDTLNLFL